MAVSGLTNLNGHWLWTCVKVLALSLVTLQVTCAASVEDGSIQLVGGKNEYEGTVLIYHMGLWGTVCDKGWDRNDAHVVCRQLGFLGERRATRRSRFGQGAAWMWMSRVRCYGNEKRLDKCRFDGWGRSNCYGGRNSAGVRCMRPRTTTPPTTTTKRVFRAPGPDVLLADQPLDVHNKTDDTNNIDGEEEEEIVVEEPTVNGTTYPTLVLDSTTRRGRLAAWRRQRVRGGMRRRRRTTTVATILDREMAEESGPGLRLMGGRFAEEGRVEVWVSGQREWKAVCGDTWGMNEGMVVCRELGMGYAKVVTSTSFYGGEQMDKVYKHVKCTGLEAQLSDCDIHVRENGVACNFTSSIAGVMCTKTLPDLIPNVTVLEDSAHLRDHHLYYLQCAMEENCLASSAYELKKNHRDWIQSVRRLMRFSSVVHNRGTDDFRPIIPKERWDWHECHMHYHSMEVFAHYDITDEHGNKVAEGHKASFCLEDSQCDPGKDKKFQCKGFADQGISVNCSDNYMAEIDCQWIDITDLTPGTYTFRVLVNPERKVAELNFENNLVSCDMFYSLYKFKVENCTIGSDPSSRLE